LRVEELERLGVGKLGVEKLRSWEIVNQRVKGINKSEEILI